MEPESHFEEISHPEAMVRTVEPVKTEPSREELEMQRDWRNFRSMCVVAHKLSPAEISAALSSQQLDGPISSGSQGKRKRKSSESEWMPLKRGRGRARTEKAMLAASRKLNFKPDDETRAYACAVDVVSIPTPKKRGRPAKAVPKTVPPCSVMVRLLLKRIDPSWIVSEESNQRKAAAPNGTHRKGKASLGKSGGSKALPASVYPVNSLSDVTPVEAGPSSWMDPEESNQRKAAAPNGTHRKGKASLGKSGGSKALPASVYPVNSLSDVTPVEAGPSSWMDPEESNQRKAAAPNGTNRKGKASLGKSGGSKALPASVYPVNSLSDVTPVEAGPSSWMDPEESNQRKAAAPNGTNRKGKASLGKSGGSKTLPASVYPVNSLSDVTPVEAGPSKPTGRRRPVNARSRAAVKSRTRVIPNADQSTSDESDDSPPICRRKKKPRQLHISPPWSSLPELKPGDILSMPILSSGSSEEDIETRVPTSPQRATSPDQPLHHVDNRQLFRHTESQNNYRAVTPLLLKNRGTGWMAARRQTLRNAGHSSVSWLGSEASELASALELIPNTELAPAVELPPAMELAPELTPAPELALVTELAMAPELPPPVELAPPVEPASPMELASAVEPTSAAEPVSMADAGQNKPARSESPLADDWSWLGLPPRTHDSEDDDSGGSGHLTLFASTVGNVDDFMSRVCDRSTTASMHWDRRALQLEIEGSAAITQPATSQNAVPARPARAKTAPRTSAMPAPMKPVSCPNQIPASVKPNSRLSPMHAPVKPVSNPKPGQVNPWLCTKTTPSPMRTGSRSITMPASVSFGLGVRTTPAFVNQLEPEVAKSDSSIRPASMKPCPESTISPASEIPCPGTVGLIGKPAKIQHGVKETSQPSTSNTTEPCTKPSRMQKSTPYWVSKQAPGEHGTNGKPQSKPQPSLKEKPAPSADPVISAMSRPGQGSKVKRANERSSVSSGLHKQSAVSELCCATTTSRCTRKEPAASHCEPGEGASSQPTFEQVLETAYKPRALKRKLQHKLSKAETPSKAVACRNGVANPGDGMPCPAEIPEQGPGAAKLISGSHVLLKRGRAASVAAANAVALNVLALNEPTSKETAQNEPTLKKVHRNESTPKKIAPKESTPKESTPNMPTPEKTPPSSVKLGLNMKLLARMRQMAMPAPAQVVAALGLQGAASVEAASGSSRPDAEETSVQGAAVGPESCRKVTGKSPQVAEDSPAEGINTSQASTELLHGPLSQHSGSYSPNLPTKVPDSETLRELVSPSAFVASESEPSAEDVSTENYATPPIQCADFWTALLTVRDGVEAVGRATRDTVYGISPRPSSGSSSSSSCSCSGSCSSSSSSSSGPPTDNAKATCAVEETKDIECNIQDQEQLDEPVVRNETRIEEPREANTAGVNIPERQEVAWEEVSAEEQQQEVAWAEVDPEEQQQEVAETEGNLEEQTEVAAVQELLQGEPGGAESAEEDLTDEADTLQISAQLKDDLELTGDELEPPRAESPEKQGADQGAAACECAGHDPEQCAFWTQEITSRRCLWLLAGRRCIERDCGYDHEHVSWLPTSLRQSDPASEAADFSAVLHALAPFADDVLLAALFTHVAERISEMAPGAAHAIVDVFPWDRQDARQAAMRVAIKAKREGSVLTMRLVRALCPYPEGTVDPAWAELLSALPKLRLSSSAVLAVLRHATEQRGPTRVLDARNALRLGLQRLPNWNDVDPALMEAFRRKLLREMVPLYREMIGMRQAAGPSQPGAWNTARRKPLNRGNAGPSSAPARQRAPDPVRKPPPLLSLPRPAGQNWEPECLPIFRGDNLIPGRNNGPGLLGVPGLLDVPGQNWPGQRFVGPRPGPRPFVAAGPNWQVQPYGIPGQNQHLPPQSATMGRPWRAPPPVMREERLSKAAIKVLNFEGAGATVRTLAAHAHIGYAPLVAFRRINWKAPSALQKAAKLVEAWRLASNGIRQAATRGISAIVLSLAVHLEQCGRYNEAGEVLINAVNGGLPIKPTTMLEMPPNFTPAAQMLSIANAYLRCDKLMHALKALEGRVLGPCLSDWLEVNCVGKPADLDVRNKLVTQLMNKAIVADFPIAFEVTSTVYSEQGSFTHPVSLLPYATRLLSSCVETCAMDPDSAEKLLSLVSMIPEAEVLSADEPLVRAVIITLHGVDSQLARRFFEKAIIWKVYPQPGRLLGDNLRAVIYSSWADVEMRMALTLAFRDYAKDWVGVPNKVLVFFERKNISGLPNAPLPSPLRKIDSSMDAAQERVTFVLESLSPPIEVSMKYSNHLELLMPTVQQYLEELRRKYWTRAEGTEEERRQFPNRF